MAQKIELVSFENIPEYTGLELNSENITVRDNEVWDGHRYGTYVGRIYKNGKVKSAFNKDIVNNNTEILDKLRNDIKLIKKYRTIRGGDEKLERVTDYYIPYMVKDHCSLKPTVKESYVDNCSNVRYLVEYEILLTAGEGFVRYIRMPFETEGHYAASFFEQVISIEDIFEEWFDEESYDFKDGEDGKQVAFYDEVGEKLFIEVTSVSELLSMIASIRVIKCDREIINIRL